MTGIPSPLDRTIQRKQEEDKTAHLGSASITMASKADIKVPMPPPPLYLDQNKPT